jgi:acyl-coenzyme A thioesterase PaaI-like protein
MTRDEDAAFLAPFFEKAKVGGILVVGEPARVGGIKAVWRISQKRGTLGFRKSVSATAYSKHRCESTRL